jgi:hypothetical protein
MCTIVFDAQNKTYRQTSTLFIKTGKSLNTANSFYAVTIVIKYEAHMQMDAPVCCLDQVGRSDFLQRSFADLEYTIIAFHKGCICTGWSEWRCRLGPQSKRLQNGHFKRKKEKKYILYIIFCALSII